MKHYSVLQVNEETANARYIMFSSYELVKKMGITLTLDMYKKVYEGDIEEAENTAETLDAIFVKLNVGRKPEDYKGHSLSVSDIIVMDGKYYYVNGIGYVEVKFKPNTQKTILIFNERTMKRERKNFKTEDEANAYYERKKSRVTLACEPSERVFSYVNEWGNRMLVQKMY